MIRECLSLKAPQSFFLYAGAGSGKTHSLIEALKFLRETRRDSLRVRGQKIGVITYTNKACDEIKERIEHDYIIEVSTIHSFVWSLIAGYDADIKVWIAGHLKEEIQELEAQQAKGKPGSKAYIDRPRQIQGKKDRLDNLKNIKKFTYNPNGENFGKDSLNHSEVLHLGAHFLANKPAMQSILVNSYPVLFIDESQDTNKELIDALFHVEEKQRAVFTLGLFGDMMQRIYLDGKENLEGHIPTRWVKPEKTTNYRCPKRVIKFINKIRSERDTHVQTPREGSTEGTIHLFLAPATANRGEAEQTARAAMATKTTDPVWTSRTAGGVKTLILEHHMAATRMGFWEMYGPLYDNDRLRNGLMTGDIPALRFFADCILPLVNACQAGDKFAVARIIRERSPLLERNYLLSKNKGQAACVTEANQAVIRFMALWDKDASPTFSEVLRRVAETGLFKLPDSLAYIAARTAEEQKLPAGEEEGQDRAITDALDKFLMAPFCQMKPYLSYITGAANFDTHQGVKGLEFERVMVTIDAPQTRGFSFDYEKLFGAKAETTTDAKNRREGKETGNDRTRRLLYVTTSRAEKSLAIVFFTEHPTTIRDSVIRSGWFDQSEVTVL
jgi:DNA helicase-2/ATP-dependent DNA helicase PcrA